MWCIGPMPDFTDWPEQITRGFESIRSTYKPNLPIRLVESPPGCSVVEFERVLAVLTGGKPRIRWKVLTEPLILAVGNVGRIWEPHLHPDAPPEPSLSAVGIRPFWWWASFKRNGIYLSTTIIELVSVDRNHNVFVATSSAL